MRAGNRAGARDIGRAFLPVVALKQIISAFKKSLCAHRSRSVSRSAMRAGNRAGARV